MNNPLDWLMIVVLPGALITMMIYVELAHYLKGRRRR